MGEILNGVKVMHSGNTIHDGFYFITAIYTGIGSHMNSCRREHVVLTVSAELIARPCESGANTPRVEKLFLNP